MLKLIPQEFVSNTDEAYSIKEMGDLIHNLQRSAMSLERKRAKLLRQERRKKKLGGSQK